MAKILDNSFDLANTCIGSPFYISPEICETKPYDRKSDIWSLGCVLFEIVTCKYAFQAKSMKALLAKITSGQHAAFPATINPNIRKIIKKLLQENPKLRPNVSDILALPYVVQHSNLYHPTQCQTNLSSRTSKSARSLSISKNCLNLKEIDISVPEEKYLSQKKNVKLNNASAKSSAICKGKINNDSVNMLIKKQNDNLKIKKLPKTNCLYYNLIEKNKKEEARKNILEKNSMAEIQQESQKHDLNIFSDYCLLNKIGEDGVSNERKKWQTGTADREQLITLLSNATLQATSTLTTLSPHKANAGKFLESRSVDDLLFMNTGELIHVEMIQPVLIPTPNTNTNTTALNDQTFVVQTQGNEGVFENLEQRRIILERELGLDIFLKLYKEVEELQKNKVNNLLGGQIEKLAAVFNVTAEQVDHVCRLVFDEFAYL